MSMPMAIADILTYTVEYVGIEVRLEIMSILILRNTLGSSDLCNYVYWKILLRAEGTCCIFW